MAVASTSQTVARIGSGSQLRSLRPANRVQVVRALRTRAVVRADAIADVQAHLGKVAALTAVAGSFLAAGNANAANEIAALAAGDGRFGIIATLFLPVIGWVGYNILGPLKNQVDGMAVKRSAAAVVGLTAASLLAAQSADAANLVSDVAAGDNRFGIIALLFVPVVGWVGFNILGPLQNQLAASTAAKKGKRAVAAGLSLTAASLLATQSAEAANVVNDLAAGDNRFGIIALLFVPVIGWVAFNIGGPLLNQINASRKTPTKGRK